MASKRLKKKLTKEKGNPATEKGSARDRLIASTGNPSKKGVPTPAAPDGFQHLHPICPEGGADFLPLSRYQVHRMTDLIMEQLKKLQSHLDMGYWRRCTKEILSASAPGIQVIPARAGAGKSTWIRAFLLSLCTLKQQGDPLADFFGGVLLILQKVEDLNDIDQMIQSAFSDAAPPLMVPLQSLTASSKKVGRH